MPMTAIARAFLLRFRPLLAEAVRMSPTLEQGFRGCYLSNTHGLEQL
jgi:hypothetical protein